VNYRVAAGLFLSAISLGAGAMEETRVQALRSGAIVIDGRPSTFRQLDAKLREIKAANGAVLYFREQPRLPATVQQLRILKAVMRAEVPIEFHRAADFSDDAGQ
jgi:hypothetical protein